MGSTLSQLDEYFVSEHYHAWQEALTGRLTDNVPAMETPIAVATMGAPGAGKSYLINSLGVACEGDISRVPHVLEDAKHQRLNLSDYNHNTIPREVFQKTVYISSDQLRYQLAGTQAVQEAFGLNGRLSPHDALAAIYAHPDHEAVQRFHTQGNRMAEALIMRASQGKKPFILDSTFGEANEPQEHAELRKHLMHSLAGAGYQMHIMPVVIDAPKAIERCAARAQQRGFSGPGAERIREYVTQMDQHIDQMEAFCEQLPPGSAHVSVFDGRTLQATSRHWWEGLASRLPDGIHLAFANLRKGFEHFVEHNHKNPPMGF